MNNQQAFDRMVEHLATQQQQAVDSEEVCTYRNERGEMCVVGALIPDEEYSSTFEGLSATNVAPLVEALSDVNHSLLNEMQSAYDQSLHWGRVGFCGWHVVQNIGEKYGLDTGKCLSNPE
jgi:hypothetical protein